jgi:hypothetical protein
MCRIIRLKVDAHLYVSGGSEVDLLAYFLLARILFSLVLVAIHHKVGKPTDKRREISRMLDDATLDANSVLKDVVLLVLKDLALLKELLDPQDRKGENNAPYDYDKNAYPILVHTCWLSFPVDASSCGLLPSFIPLPLSSTEIDVGCEKFHKALRCHIESSGATSCETRLV